MNSKKLRRALNLIASLAVAASMALSSVCAVAEDDADLTGGFTSASITMPTSDTTAAESTASEESDSSTEQTDTSESDAVTETEESATEQTEEAAETAAEETESPAEETESPAEETATPAEATAAPTAAANALMLSVASTDGTEQSHTVTPKDSYVDESTGIYTYTFEEFYDSDSLNDSGYTEYGGSADEYTLDSYMTVNLTGSTSSGTATYVTSDGKVYLMGSTAVNDKSGNPSNTSNSYIAFTAPLDGSVVVSGTDVGMYIDNTYAGYSTSNAIDMTMGETLYMSYRKTSTYVSSIIFTPSSSVSSDPINGTYEETTSTYTWSFETSAVSTSSGTTYTDSDGYMSTCVSLGTNDKIIASDSSTSCGIYFTSPSESSDSTNGSNIGNTGRYIMVTPQQSGTITFTLNFIADNATCGLYYGVYADSDTADSNLADLKTTEAPNAIAYGCVGTIKSTESYDYKLPLTKGYTYVFFIHLRGCYITAMSYDMSNSSSISPIVTGKNIDLTSGVITMNAYVDSSVASTVTYKLGSADSTTFSGSAATVENYGTVYTVSQNIPAAQMADTFAVTVKLNNAGVYSSGSTTLSSAATYTYQTSVKDYANYAINNWDSETYAKELAVLNAMLDYGSAVQTLADYNTSNLANGGTYQDGVKNVDATELAGVVTKKTTPSGGTGWSGPALQSMNMNFNYNFNLGMTYDSVLSDYTVTVTLDGTSYEVDTLDSDSSDSTSYKVVISDNSIIIKDLSAADLYKKLVVTLTPSTSTASDEDSSTESVTSYSTTTMPLYYARLLLSTSGLTDDQKQLGRTLYKFADAVNTLNTKTSE